MHIETSHYRYRFLVDHATPSSNDKCEVLLKLNQDGPVFHCDLPPRILYTILNYNLCNYLLYTEDQFHTKASKTIVRTHTKARTLIIVGGFRGLFNIVQKI